MFKEAARVGLCTAGTDLAGVEGAAHFHAAASEAASPAVLEDLGATHVVEEEAVRVVKVVKAGIGD